MGRTLTEALHGVRAEDPAHPLRPEVVAGNIFTVAPAEHQLVAVFFLLRFHILMGQGPLFGHLSSRPLPRARQPRQTCAGGAALSLTAHSGVPCTDPTPGVGSRQLRAGESVSSQAYTPPPAFLGTGSVLLPPAKLKTEHPDSSTGGRDNTTYPNPS